MSCLVYLNHIQPCMESLIDLWAACHYAVKHHWANSGPTLGQPYHQLAMLGQSWANVVPTYFLPLLGQRWANLASVQSWANVVPTYFLPPVSQRWADGQNDVGPTSVPDVGPTDLLSLGQRWPTTGVLSGTYIWLQCTLVALLTYGCSVRSRVALLVWL